MTRRRLDAELVRRKMAPSRTAAQRIIDEGKVTVGGQTAWKAARQVEASEAIEIVGDNDNYASRGAYKLLGALDQLGTLAPKVQGRNCLDVGASTGGFTDVLLRRGASSVAAVDVGYGQLVWRLRTDPRVQVLERTNVRYLKSDDLTHSPDLVVGDLSFISIETVLPALAEVASDADFLLMIKPQFEVGKGKVGAGGVVRDPQLRIEAIIKVANGAIKNGLIPWAIEASPLPGPSGNVEYFIAMSKNPMHPAIKDIAAAARKAVETGPQAGLSN